MHIKIATINILKKIFYLQKVKHISKWTQESSPFLLSFPALHIQMYQAVLSQKTAHHRINRSDKYSHHHHSFLKITKGISHA